MKFNPSFCWLFLATKLKGKPPRWNKPNDIVSFFTSMLEILFQNSLSSSTSIEVVVNVYPVFFHIKSGNICERFPTLTCRNMYKVTVTPRNKNWLVFFQGSWLDRNMFAEISVIVVESETFALCPHNFVFFFFQGPLGHIQPSLTLKTMFTCFCAYVEKAKNNGFKTIEIKK